MNHFSLHTDSRIWVFLCLSVLVTACNDPYETSYRVTLPNLPDTWTEIAGIDRWHIEWINSSGDRESRDIHDAAVTGDGFEIHILQEWASPVIAYPYRSGTALTPAIMRPAGAIFPSDADVSSGTISLTWTGGVAAFLYLELARHTDQSSIRQPHYFDWQRFRELLESDIVPEDVRSNPWLADWKTIAKKTVSSGFDRRRITAIKPLEISIPAPVDGAWIGTSPFSAPITATGERGETLILQVCDAIDAYVSKDGVLRVSSNAWIWIGWRYR
ncbi:MAG: hypothetical protein LBB61_01280 [Treponema sp.]|jgi:hypothetical protein|nr:hypothetical protein [Treponema sp.]